MRAAPLLTWPEDARLARLEAERQALQRRINELPKMSHRRVELTARLAAVTTQELRLELGKRRAS